MTLGQQVRWKVVRFDIARDKKSFRGDFYLIREDLSEQEIKESARELKDSRRENESDTKSYARDKKNQ